MKTDMATVKDVRLTESQRAAVAAKLANMAQGERTDREPSANLQKVSQADAAQMLNVSTRSVAAAAKVLHDGDEELVHAVERGGVAELSLCGQGSLIDLSTNQIAAMLTESLRRTSGVRRQRGRPRRKTREFFADVLKGHQGVVAWHTTTYGEPARSEAALYKAFRWHVAQTVDADGVVALAALEAATWPRLKTVLNTLAEARAFFRKHPEKPPFTGTDKVEFEESNTQEEEQQ